MTEELKIRTINGKKHKYINYTDDGIEGEFPSDYYVKIKCDNGYKQAVKEENHGTLNKLIHSKVEANVEAIVITTYIGKYKTLLIDVEFMGDNNLEVLHFDDIMMLYMLKMFVDNNKHQLNIEEDSSYNIVNEEELYNLTCLDNVGVKYLGEELKFNQTIYVDDDNKIMKRFKEELVKDELKELVNYYKVKSLKITIKGSNQSSEISLSLIKPNGNEVNKFERSYLQKYLILGSSYTLLDYIDDMKLKELMSYAHSINNSIDWRYTQSKRRGETYTKSELVSKIIKEDLKEISLEEYITSNVFRSQGEVYSIRIGKRHLVNVLNAEE